MQKTAVKSDMSLSGDFIGIFMQDKSEFCVFDVLNNIQLLTEFLHFVSDDNDDI